MRVRGLGNTMAWSFSGQKLRMPLMSILSTEHMVVAQKSFLPKNVGTLYFFGVVRSKRCERVTTTKTLLPLLVSSSLLSETHGCARAMTLCVVESLSFRRARVCEKVRACATVNEGARGARLEVVLFFSFRLFF